MQLTNKTYYDLLGVRRKASPKEIKEAYREIARIYHPDSNFYLELNANTQQITPPDDTMIKLLNEAYRVLSNPRHRTEYDRTLPPEVNTWEDGGENSNLQPQEFLRGKEGAISFGVFGQVCRDHEEDPEVERFVAEQKSSLQKSFTIPGKIWLFLKRMFFSPA